MKLLFKQRFFSFLDSYDIYDEYGKVMYTVKAKFTLGQTLHINDAMGNHVATIKRKIFSFMPKYEFYVGENFIGSMTKEFTFFRQAFNLDFNGWYVNGNFMGWDYDIQDAGGRMIAMINKELFNFTDTYVMDIPNPENALYALMVVVAIDAEKAASDNSASAAD